MSCQRNPDLFRLAWLYVSLEAGGSFGQIFIPDARPGRSLEVFKDAGVAVHVFLTENGQIGHQ